MPRKPKTAAPAAAKGELREEVEVRRLKARIEKHALREQIKTQKAMLATYAAADRGRRNKNWRAPLISADLAIIPDAAVMNGRARQLVRDTWIGQSAVAAYARNVVGCGIIPIPQARDSAGNLLPDVNKLSLGLFWTWASDARWCDVEQDQTHWQQQALAERERATVGEAFWLWSYEPHLLNDGITIDLSRPVGLRIQAFEPEQLDLTKLSFGQNEVRGGIEIDALGRAVAYHVYTRNPNDFLARTHLASVRIQANRVFHYFRKDRIRQKRGESPLACVMQDIHDVSRGKDAFLWRQIMEACVGGMVKRDPSVPSIGGGMAGLLPSSESGSGGAAGNTTPEVDWFPGMIIDPGPGKTFEPFIPTAPGNQYDSFQRSLLRGIGAGLRISYGQISRDFTQGTYSGQRQEMLEDRKEFEPQQEMIAHNLVLQVYRLFFALAVHEGRFGDDVATQFAVDPLRMSAAEYVAPPPTWIDPKAEADALEKMIQLRVITREEIAHMRGMRLSDVLSKIAAERNEAKALDIVLPEDAEIAALAQSKASVTQPPGTAPMPSRTQLKVLGSAVPAEVPDYRASSDADVKCGACRFFLAGKCQAYDFAADPNFVCESFETAPLLEDMPSQSGRDIIATPPLQDGQRSIDDPKGPFLNSIDG